MAIILDNPFVHSTTDSMTRADIVSAIEQHRSLYQAILKFSDSSQISRLRSQLMIAMHELQSEVDSRSP